MKRVDFSEVTEQSGAPAPLHPVQGPGRRAIPEHDVQADETQLRSVTRGQHPQLHGRQVAAMTSQVPAMPQKRPGPLRLRVGYGTATASRAADLDLPALLAQARGGLRDAWVAS